MCSLCPLVQETNKDSQRGEREVIVVCYMADLGANLSDKPEFGEERAGAFIP